MNKSSLYLLLIFIFTISCSSSKNDSDPKDVVQNYYQALNQGNYLAIGNCLSDTLTMREIEYDFEISYSKDEYKDWFQWDSVFNPSYQILEINERNDSIFATYTKTCTRIQLLLEDTIICNAHFEIVDNKLRAINRLSYPTVNWDVWGENRQKLIDWVDQNHPELSDFMDVQNKEYAEKYLKVINLYLDAE